MIKFTNPDVAAIASATKILYSKYRDYVEYEDVQQELYLWLLTHYDRAEGWREKYEVRHAERTVVKALRNAGERYCRQEKAESAGFSADDEFYYSIPMVADLLQLYFDPEWMIPSGMDLTTAGTTGGTPASESGNLMVMVADVGRAYEALPMPDKDLLHEIYGGKVVVTDAIATKSIEWSCTYSAANSRIRRVVGRVRAGLGGPDPYKEID